MSSTSPTVIDPARPMPECPVQDMEELVGKVLSLLEYGIEDERRLKAGKQIVKQTMWNWYTHLPEVTSNLSDVERLLTQ